MTYHLQERLTGLGFTAVYLSGMIAMMIGTADRLAGIRHAAQMFVCLPVFILGAAALLIGRLSPLDPDPPQP